SRPRRRWDARHADVHWLPSFALSSGQRLGGEVGGALHLRPAIAGLMLRVDADDVCLAARLDDPRRVHRPRAVRSGDPAILHVNARAVWRRLTNAPALPGIHLA